MPHLRFLFWAKFPIWASWWYFFIALWLFLVIIDSARFGIGNSACPEWICALHAKTRRFMQQIRDSQMRGAIILSTKVEKSFDRRKWRSEYYLTRGLYSPEAILFFSLLKLFLSLYLCNLGGGKGEMARVSQLSWWFTVLKLPTKKPWQGT